MTNCSALTVTDRGEMPYSNIYGGTLNMSGISAGDFASPVLIQDSLEELNGYGM